MAITAQWVTAYLGLGSNLGDRLAMLRLAVDAIGRLSGVRVDVEAGVGPVFETGPVGMDDAAPFFLNTAVRVFTSLGPHELLTGLQDVETALGRVRGRRWDDRTIDIDLLLFDDLVVDDERLTLPHRGLAARRFVLEPLSAIAGAVVHPVCGVRIAELAGAARAADRGGDMVVHAAAGWLTAAA